MTDTVTTSRRSRTKIWSVVIAVAVTALLIVAVLIAQQALRSHYEESHHYDNAAAIPAHNGLFVLPPWAPGDATNITINVQTQGKGRSLTFTTATPTLPAQCVAASAPKQDPVPTLALSDHVRDSAGYRCAEWFVARDGSTVLAWTPYGS
ncbi:MAG TPA: hypothetical protein VFG87_26300 [Amycolatopsis sp.]|nr:hypothetical protein [Amycolatopsis sp.]